MKTSICITLLLAAAYFGTRAANKPRNWTASQIANAIGEHRNDPDWIPNACLEGGYIVKTFDGKIVKPPNLKETD